MKIADNNSPHNITNPYYQANIRYAENDLIDNSLFLSTFYCKMWVSSIIERISQFTDVPLGCGVE